MADEEYCCGYIFAWRCSCSATRLRSLASWRRSFQADRSVTIYSSSAPDKNASSTNMPRGKAGACQPNTFTCTSIVNVATFSYASTASTPPTRTKMMSITTSTASSSRENSDDTKHTPLINKPHQPAVFSDSDENKASGMSFG